ncbi:type II toxin-antitoxin system RelE/ParE family toxin [Sphingobacteriales bacterium CHB3]|nr:type II toxin-antitoxin system RelE/ParE family toxin [Sphingobacteriales bacterium CHB3]
MKHIEFHLEAVQELIKAKEWYRLRSEMASQAFALEVDNAIRSIADAPERWPESEGGIRRKVLQRFPYTVLYRTRSETIYVIAVAHQRRRPGYLHTRK